MSLICGSNNAIGIEEKDPLEIIEDICIKEEEFSQSIKQELEDIDVYDALPKIVDVKDLLKNSNAVVNTFIYDSNKSNISCNTKKSFATKINVKKVSKKKSERKSIRKSIVPKIQNLISNNVTVTTSGTDGNFTLAEVSTQSTNEKLTFTVKNFTNLFDKSNLTNSKHVKDTSDKKILVPTFTKVPASVNKVLIPPGNNKYRCNCMRYIKLFCSNCDKSFFYRKNLTQCITCKTLLKLQCSECFKRYSYLSSVHQYVLQMTKRQNLLNENKAVKFNCVKKLYYLCSKCNNKYNSKEQLEEHIQLDHSNPSVTILNSLVTVSNPPVPTSKQMVTDSESPVTKSNMQNLFLEKSDQFIRLSCKHCKNRMECPNVCMFSFKAQCKDCNVDMVFQCTICNKLYMKLIYARKHVKNCMHLHDSFFCYYCQYRVTEKALLLAHIRVYHTPAICSDCNMKFENDNMLEQHKIGYKCVIKKRQLAHSQIPMTKPEEINKAENKDDDIVEIFANTNSSGINNMMKNFAFVSDTKNSTDFENNFVIVDKDPATILQQITGSPYKDSGGLDWGKIVDYYCTNCKIHLENNNSVNRPVCLKCTHKFGYRCTFCAQVFQDSKAIFQHMKSDCRMQERLACQLCSFSTTHKHVLFKHIKVHHTIFKCLKCKGNFTGFEILIKHIYRCKPTAKHSRNHIEKLIALFCTSCNKIINKQSMKPSPKPLCPKCTAPAHYRCLKCKNFYNDYKITFKHITTTCKPKYACKSCEFKAYEPCELEVHTRSMHRN